MAAQVGIGIRVTRSVAVGAVVLAVALPCTCPRGPLSAEPARSDSTGEETNPLGANAACYVCHIPFVKEELSKTHLKAKVPCTKCHGLSAGHANDEDIGATPPDVLFPRNRIDKSCRECHKGHNVPAREVVARFLVRKLPLGRTAVCTDCHGRHKIQRPAEQ